MYAVTCSSSSGCLEAMAETLVRGNNCFSRTALSATAGVSRRSSASNGGFMRCTRLSACADALACSLHQGVRNVMCQVGHQFLLIN